MARAYRLRSIPNGTRGSDGKRYQNYSLTVPPEIAKAVPDDMEFVCHIDEKGIHYTPTELAMQSLPSWATGMPNPNEKPQRPVKVKS